MPRGKFDMPIQNSLNKTGKSEMPLVAVFLNGCERWGSLVPTRPHESTSSTPSAGSNIQKLLFLPLNRFEFVLLISIYR